MGRKPRVIKKKCLGCAECAIVCPYNAIRINKGGKAKINYKKCKGCLACVDACPMNALIVND
jgi:2-oxoacid:acceptor oxidoreductase delta subunit (pyruvate/2-ketoisovalerate family)